jgi:hypothetical protein
MNYPHPDGASTQCTATPFLAHSSVAFRLGSGNDMQNDSPVPTEFCDHIEPGGWPFQVALTFDEHLGLTDALVTCRHCDRPYLIEMLDWEANRRVMRISMLDPVQAATVVRDLTRGSCDIRRAGAEVHHLRTQSAFSPWLLLIDMQGPIIEAVVPMPHGIRLPGGGWRDLPCDGRWVAYARSKTSITNG